MSHISKAVSKTRSTRLRPVRRAGVREKSERLRTCLVGLRRSLASHSTRCESHIRPHGPFGTASDPPDAMNAADPRRPLDATGNAQRAFRARTPRVTKAIGIRTWPASCQFFRPLRRSNVGLRDPYDAPARCSRPGPEPWIDPERADCRELTAGVHERDAPTLPGRNPERLKSFLQRAPACACPVQLRCVLATEPHHDSSVDNRLIKPILFASFPGEASVLEFEHLRNPPHRAPRGRRAPPWHQANAAAEPAYVYVSNTHARHGVLSCPDDRTVDFLDSASPG